MIKVAFFDTKSYDKPSFEKYGKDHGLEIKFFETKLTEDTAELAKGFDGVCIFVNDTASAPVIDKLHAFGVSPLQYKNALHTPIVPDPHNAN